MAVKKLWNLTVLTFVVGLSVLSCKNSESQWKELTSTEGEFSILMPGEPSKTKQTIDTMGVLIEQQCVFFEKNTKKGSVSYWVSYCDYPDSLVQPAEPILNGALRGAVIGSGGELFSEQVILLDGFPGREYKIKRPDEVVIIGRMYLVNQRLYQILIEGQNEIIPVEDIRKFLNSFNLLKK